jgi:uncharacterized protein YbjQ (UPF0145 family)
MSLADGPADGELLGARAVGSLSSHAVDDLRAGARNPEIRSGRASTSEALALEHAGYRPIAAISGTAVCLITNSIGYNGSSTVTENLSTGMELARSTAASRLAHAAAGHGAVGVIDVRTSIRWHGAGTSREVEISLTGTAVDGRGYRANRPASAEPFVATLNGVDIARLAWSGWIPVGLAFGVAVRGFSRRRRLPFWTGGEAAALTQALYEAREAAMRRLQAAAEHQHARGVLGIDIIQNAHVWGHRAVEFAAVGTAVARTGAAEEIHPPEFGISLETPRKGRVVDVSTTPRKWNRR